jgi:hypothetical protein
MSVVPCGTMQPRRPETTAANPGAMEAARALDSFLRAWEPVAFGGRGADATGYSGLRELAAEGGVRG